MLRLNRPPIMSTLLEDPLYQKYMKTRPKLPEQLQYGTPWHLWVLTDDDKWRRGKFEDYDGAYLKMKKLLRREDIIDVSIVSIRMLFPPPRKYDWPSAKYPWCSRCRRPTVFLHRYSHRALGDIQTTYDEPWRCFYCGMRRVSMPRYYAFSY